MSQDLQAGPVTLLQLFKGEREYRSPLFQRRYVWGGTEIEKLYNDVDEILEVEGSTRFLGALVLEVAAAGMAFQPDSSWIVDGQQRLTTLYMALLHIAQYAESAGEKDLANSLFTQYLFNQDGEYRNKPKVTPTFLDNQQFNDLFSNFRSVAANLPKPFGEKRGQLQKASGLIQRRIRERCFNGRNFNAEKATTLIKALLEKLKFVQIVLGDNQDPHQVFDSLNALGVRLENKDLIRNIVFQRLSESPTDAESLYNRRWIPFEQELGDDLESYFFPFTLIHRPTVTKSSLLTNLRDRWRDWNPDQIVDDLRVYVPAFNALSKDDRNARDSLSESQVVNDLMWRFHRMKAPTTLYPYILKLVTEFRSGAIAEDWAVRNLKQIESFVVRRSLAGFEPSGLHAIFKDLWHKTKGDPMIMVKEIDASPTIRFPEDDEFSHDIKERPLYGRRMAGYILAEYERGLIGGDPMPEVDITIDHVMPRELTEVWKEVISEDDHKALKDTWANLVPLSGPANAEKGRKPWSEIRPFFMTETIFKTTKRLAQTNEDWNAPKIRTRGEQLAIWAVSRWPKRA